MGDHAEAVNTVALSTKTDGFRLGRVVTEFFRTQRFGSLTITRSGEAFALTVKTEHWGDLLAILRRNHVRIVEEEN